MSGVVVSEVPDADHDRRFAAVLCLVLDAVRMSLPVANRHADGTVTGGADAREAICNLVNAAVLIAVASGQPEDGMHAVIRQTFSANAGDRERWRGVLEEAIGTAAREVAEMGGATEVKANA